MGVPGAFTAACGRTRGTKRRDPLPASSIQWRSSEHTSAIMRVSTTATSSGPDPNMSRGAPPRRLPISDDSHTAARLYRRARHSVTKFFREQSTEPARNPNVSGRHWRRRTPPNNRLKGPCSGTFETSLPADTMVYTMDIKSTPCPEIEPLGDDTTAGSPALPCR